jgi:hypothetical protein
MPDKPTFVVNDRRKFTSEGELRHDAPAADPASASQPGTPESADAAGPRLVTGSELPSAAQATDELADLPESEAVGQLYPDPEPGSGAEPVSAEEDSDSFPDDGSLPPGPTAEQAAEAARAYEATVDRLDTAMRAANPGGERMPAMTFDRLVQSLYTQALLLLGGAAEPGETPRVDILGARQTIDMLSVIAQKVQNNLSSAEDKLLQSALFDLHMGFLEITQALARQAAQRQGGAGPAGGGLPPMGGGAGPRIVR